MELADPEVGTPRGHVSCGARGRGNAGAKGPVGSVVERVIRDAPCPVLAVRVKEA
jgi:nucleotide-binding universal stress UspA family protein